MPKGTLKKVIGVIICLAAFFIVFDHPIYAFDFFGLFKPSKQEAYQAQGSFEAAPYGLSLKNKGARQARGAGYSNFAKVDYRPPTTSTLTLQVDEDGNITGSGQIGRIACWWYVKTEDGLINIALIDFVDNFSFSGKTDGDNLKGQVTVTRRSSGGRGSGRTDTFSPNSWSAKRKGDTISGTIANIERINLKFTAKVGAVTPGEPSPTPEITLIPSPSPTPGEKRKLKLLNLEGKPLINGEARIRLKDGTFKDVEVKNGEIVYDSGLVQKITVKDLDDPKNRKLTLQPDDLEQGKAIIASQEEWLNQIMPKLEALAKILNDGQEIDINKYFEINPDADEAEHKPPLLDFLRKLGFKDKINFNAEQMAWTADVNTVIHEILGHAFTEVIGEGNEMIYGGAGSHDDPWQPAFKERSIFNPARWFRGKTAALSEDKAKGMALSEGWAQYVGDKWDRELKNIPDEESELTTTNAQQKMAETKDGIYGKLYSEQSYGAKVENVVATVFNEIYKGKSLEKAVADFTAVRKEFKRIHNGKSFQTINQFIYQKLDMIEDVSEKERVEKLIKDLVLE